MPQRLLPTYLSHAQCPNPDITSPAGGRVRRRRLLEADRPRGHARRGRRVRGSAAPRRADRAAFADRGAGGGRTAPAGRDRHGRSLGSDRAAGPVLGHNRGRPGARAHPRLPLLRPAPFEPSRRHDAGPQRGTRRSCRLRAGRDPHLCDRRGSRRGGGRGGIRLPRAAAVLRASARPCRAAGAGSHGRRPRAGSGRARARPGGPLCRGRSGAGQPGPCCAGRPAGAGPSASAGVHEPRVRAVRGAPPAGGRMAARPRGPFDRGGAQRRRPL